MNMEYDNSQYIRNQRLNQWKTAIGLQAVDGLQPSDYLYELAGKHIEGELNIQEVKTFLKSYYEDKENRDNNQNTNEADKVSANIMSILDDGHFMLCADEYRSIHESLFYDVFPHAGVFRVRNISKREWILQRDSVEYGDYRSIASDLKYAMDNEAKFDYSNLSTKEKINHFSKFIANIWQIHPFFEGNTRTTAIFAIKYLRSMGRDIDNEIFRNHSFFFRNALVRACYENNRLEVKKDFKYLNNFFYNLLEGEKNALQNRDMLILPPEGWNVEEKKNKQSDKKTIITIKRKLDNIDIYKHNGDIHCIKCSIDDIEQKGKHLRFEDLMKWYKIKKSDSLEEKEMFISEMANKYFEKELTFKTELSNIRIYPDKNQTKLFIKAENNGMDISAIEMSANDKLNFENVLKKGDTNEIESLKNKLAIKYFEGLSLNSQKSKGIKQ